MTTNLDNPSTNQERSALRTFHTPEKIQHVIPNLKAEARGDYVVEWGARVTDGALVFHFFPPLLTNGQIGKWPADSTMDKKLERAIPEVFDVGRITAGYEKDWDSFYVIAGGYASSLDARLLAKRFFDAVDSP
jgi:hypothetical protein